MKYKKLALLFSIFLLMNLNSFAQKEDIYKLTINWDKSSKTKIYIPNDLDESFVELDKMLHPKFIEKYKTGEINSVDLHHGLGMWLRNNWGLWAGERLAKYFNNLEIFHPDDMSSIILNSYKLHLNGKPIELEKQIQGYKDYWEAAKSPQEKVFAQCPQGVELKGSLHYNRVEGEKYRVTHYGYCKSDNKLWVYENGKGWFEPTEEMLKRINRNGSNQVVTVVKSGASKPLKKKVKQKK
ncbi:MAG: hypothetical protein MUC29_08200 [Pyrinomonadaceae bacterium]|jgi:hypothetical protein|nr:hypothetical protein [Pyrinomonadaceae bacterium]